MRVKTVRKNPERVETEETYVPRYFYGVHKFVTFTADVMFVNGVPFIMTFSRNIQLFTVELIPIRTAAQIISHLMKVVKLYSKGGFSIRTILMDQ